ncbi:MAG: ATP-binding protein [Saprospiraceae bacterium]|nr:ATP-binding protein [Lewinella sp.]
MQVIKKIVITGPESSGKTTLTQQLARYFQTQWVPEYARIYLEELDRPYLQDDLLTIAIGQVTLEDSQSQSVRQYLFCDTGLEVIRIWSLVKYKEVDPQIEYLLKNRSYDQYLLCAPDLNWEPDPLRETPNEPERWQLFEYYQQELQRLGIPWSIVSGEGEARLQSALRGIRTEE